MNGKPKKSIKLALQGGGSHGAFTWGVLDRLLEDERLDIAAVSGTSAGAMNAVALADGMARDYLNADRHLAHVLQSCEIGGISSKYFILSYQQ